MGIIPFVFPLTMNGRGWLPAFSLEFEGYSSVTVSTVQFSNAPALR